MAGRPGRRRLFNVAVVGAVLGLTWFGAEFAFDRAAEKRMQELREEKNAAAGKWSIEEGVSRRFNGRAFIMASAGSALTDGDHYYDLSLICYGPGEAGALLLVLLYKVVVTADGLGAHPLGIGDRAELVRTEGGSEFSLTLAYDTASEALETRVDRDVPDVSERIFNAPFSDDSPLLVRSAAGNAVFTDSTTAEFSARRRVLDACSPENVAG